MHPVRKGLFLIRCRVITASNGDSRPKSIGVRNWTQKWKGINNDLQSEWAHYICSPNTLNIGKCEPTELTYCIKRKKKILNKKKTRQACYLSQAPWQNMDFHTLVVQPPNVSTQLRVTTSSKMHESLCSTLQKGFPTRYLSQAPWRNMVIAMGARPQPYAIPLQKEGLALKLVTDPRICKQPRSKSGWRTRAILIDFERVHTTKYNPDWEVTVVILCINRGKGVSTLTQVRVPL